jgi:hypothetical protein
VSALVGQAPAISSLSPAATTAGGGAFTLTVNGSGFVAPFLLIAGSRVQWNGAALSTEYVSDRQLRAAVSASLIATPGSANVSVLNPDGATSPVVTFIIHPPPAITTASPLPGGMTGVAYSQALAVAGGTAPYTWSLTSGSLPAGLAISADGAISGTPSAAGEFNFTVRVTDAAGTSATKAFSLTISAATAPLVVDTVSLPAAMVGAAYSHTLSASGGAPPYAWSVAAGSLPAGLALSATGVISGTPSSAGDFPFTVRVTDSRSASATKALTITVNASRPPPSITSPSPLPSGTVGASYSYALTASGGTPPYTWTVVGGSLPPGLTLSSGGALGGTPTASGDFSFQVQVTDSAAGVATKVFTLTINSAPSGLAITTASPLPTGTLGVAYSHTLAAAGGAPPYAWMLTSGTLPPNLTLSISGTQEGTPAAAGDYAFTVQVSDSRAGSATKSFALSISPSAPALTITTSSPLPGAVMGQSYSHTLSANGGTSPYRWSFTGSLPPGLVLSPAGIIDGTPTSGGTFSFTVTVTDAVGATASRGVVLAVSVPGAAPGIVFSGLSDSLSPAQQVRIDLRLDQGYAANITGDLTLSFTPDAVNATDDPAIQFSAGARTVTFNIPANSTQAAFPVTPLLLQTGTVSGRITLTVRMRAGGSEITPSPASRTVAVSRAAPVINTVRVVRTAAGFDVLVTGYATPREVTRALFRFTPAPGAAVQTTELDLDLSAAFNNWYRGSGSAVFGSQFTLTQPFTVSGGDAASIQSVTVTLRNSHGDSPPASGAL